MLRVDGAAIVDHDGAPVRLRGVGVGGWMNMENFITGYPGTESELRAAVAGVLGAERAERFFARLLDRFFAAEDAALLAELGFNCVRLPVNARHFQRADGFARLDRAVRDCAAHGLYSVLDLHAVAGGQNQHWHSDNPTHVASFWLHRELQDGVVALWESLAERYRGEPWVAGYNLLNEPADPTGEVVGPFHDRLVAAVRAVDPAHIVFVDGNTYSTDFSVYGDPYENAVYACHDYAFGEPERDAIEAKFLERTRYQRATGTPVWVGEFGPTYTGDPELDAERDRVLRDQLAVYDEHDAGWSLWTYKDVGLQGIVYADPDGPYRRRFGALIDKKARLGVDAWGSDPDAAAGVLEPLHALVAREFPDWDPYPWGARRTTRDLVRHILFATALTGEYAERLRGLDDAELDALADSFALERCVRREALCETLAGVAR